MAGVVGVPPLVGGTDGAGLAGNEPEPVGAGVTRGPVGVGVVGVVGGAVREGVLRVGECGGRVDGCDRAGWCVWVGVLGTPPPLFAAGAGFGRTHRYSTNTPTKSTTSTTVDRRGQARPPGRLGRRISCSPWPARSRRWWTP